MARSRSIDCVMAVETKTEKVVVGPSLKERERAGRREKQDKNSEPPPARQGIINCRSPFRQ